MKFSIFHQIESYDDSISYAQLQEELKDLTLQAEAGGFDKVWIGEHHGMGFAASPNAFTSLAYIAALTKTIRLGTGTSIAPFYHPIRLAGEIGQLDVMSNGRLEVGIARGAYNFEYERQYPGYANFSGETKNADVAWDAGQRMREMVPAVQKLIAGNYEHDGVIWSWPSTTATPWPVQKPYPPMYIAARDPNTHSFAIANDCNVQVTPLALGDDEAQVLMDKFNGACAENPDKKRPEVMILMHLYTAESEAELAEGAKNISEFYHHFMKWFKNAGGVNKVSQGHMEPISDAERDANPQYAPEVMRKNMIIGTPDEVIARLKKLEAMGYDEFSIWVDSHMNFEQKSKALQLFIDKVLPAFK
jgi:alkanesulfonate monooxygenase SsuD/methylene tetrahydromethanopterin reductase-like flavin-dependent oxidoreductase (luciferase family)